MSRFLFRCRHCHGYATAARLAPKPREPHPYSIVLPMASWRGEGALRLCRLGLESPSLRKEWAFDKLVGEVCDWNRYDEANGD